MRAGKGTTDPQQLDQLALLDPVGDEQPSDRQWIAARADLERIMALPRTGPVRRRVPALKPWAFQRLAMAGAVLGTAGVATVVFLAAQTATGGPEPATPAARPTTAATTDDTSDVSRKPLTPRQLRRVGTACAKELNAGEDVWPPLRASDVILAERRPNSETTVIMGRGDNVLECDLTEGRWGGSAPLEDEDGLYPEPDATSVVVLNGPMTAETREGWVGYSAVTGKAGADVTGVDIVLGDGTRIEAPLSEGWWTAWWPENYPRWHRELEASWQVVVHTRDGAQTSWTEDQITVKRS